MGSGAMSHEAECLLLKIDGQFSFSFLDPHFRARNLSYFLLHPWRTTTARKMMLYIQSSETNTNSKAKRSPALPGLTQSSAYQPLSVVGTFRVKALVMRPPDSLYLGLEFYDVSPPCLCAPVHHFNHPTCTPWFWAKCAPSCICDHSF